MDKFYRILDNVEFADRWWLKSPREPNGNPIDSELFCNGKLLNFCPPLTIAVRHHGKPLDWTFADFDMPVVTKRTADLLRNICRSDIQFFEANVEGYNGDFEILNVLKAICCLDEEKSDILFWNKEDGRPDKIGQYRQVVNMRISPSQVESANMFRIAGWEIALIVAEKIKTEFEKANIRGVRFVDV
ncbi:MAG: imm11 family protein [Limisphaerales bacterium]